jgi:methionyl-tRNA synthetase
MLQPFIPNLAEKVLNFIKTPVNEREFIHISMDFKIKSGTQIEKPNPIFPKYL